MVLMQIIGHTSPINNGIKYQGTIDKPLVSSLLFNKPLHCSLHIYHYEYTVALRMTLFTFGTHVMFHI